MGKHPESPKRVTTLLKIQKGKCSHCGLHFRDEDVMEVDTEFLNRKVERILLKTGTYFTDIATIQRLQQMAVWVQNLAVKVLNLSHPHIQNGSGKRICW